MYSSKTRLLLFCAVNSVRGTLSVLLVQRNETLLVEYKKLGRGNRVVDHRIGENDPAMSFDEKMARRFALERQVFPCILRNYSEL